MGHMTRVAYYRVTRPVGRLGLSPLVLVSRALRARSTGVTCVPPEPWFSRKLSPGNNDFKTIYCGSPKLTLFWGPLKVLGGI
jgi:hypothetical protein